MRRAYLVSPEVPLDSVARLSLGDETGDSVFHIAVGDHSIVTVSNVLFN